MSSGSSSLLVDGVSVILAGFCIKFLDDHVDREADLSSGRSSFDRVFGGTLLPYSVLALAFACILNVRLASSLLFASWALGMMWEEGRRFPLGLPGWLESFIVLALGSILIGPREQLTSLVAILGVQAFDDIVDYTRGPSVESRNLARRLGVRMATFATIAILAVGCLWNSYKMMLVAIGALGVFFGERLVESGGEGRGV